MNCKQKYNNITVVYHVINNVVCQLFTCKVGMLRRCAPSNQIRTIYIICINATINRVVIVQISEIVS